MQEVLRILDGYGPVLVSVHELAARVGLRPSRLEHLFRGEVHTSIRQYVQQRRLRCAAEMLTRSHERISTIAFSVGYNDVPNFNHAFRKHFGQSPGQYRRQAARA